VTQKSALSKIATGDELLEVKGSYFSYYLKLCHECSTSSTCLLSDHQLHLLPPSLKLPFIEPVECLLSIAKDLLETIYK
jgi:hypothetical protein